MEQNEQTSINNWVKKEAEDTQKTQMTGERLPSLKLETGKIVSFTIDFSSSFNKWSDGTVTKALIPVVHKNDKKILWLNIKNPLYGELLTRGATGEVDFKVSTTGSAKDTRYTIVEED